MRSICSFKYLLHQSFTFFRVSTLSICNTSLYFSQSGQQNICFTKTRALACCAAKQKHQDLVHSNHHPSITRDTHFLLDESEQYSARSSYKSSEVWKKVRLVHFWKKKLKNVQLQKKTLNCHLLVLCKIIWSARLMQTEGSIRSNSCFSVLKLDLLCIIDTFLCSKASCEWIIQKINTLGSTTKNKAL